MTTQNSYYSLDEHERKRLADHILGNMPFDMPIF